MIAPALFHFNIIIKIDIDTQEYVIYPICKLMIPSLQLLTRESFYKKKKRNETMQQSNTFTQVVSIENIIEWTKAMDCFIHQ